MRWRCIRDKVAAMRVVVIGMLALACGGQTPGAVTKDFNDAGASLDAAPSECPTDGDDLRSVHVTVCGCQAWMVLRGTPMGPKCWVQRNLAMATVDGPAESHLCEESPTLNCAVTEKRLETTCCSAAQMRDR